MATVEQLQRAGYRMEGRIAAANVEWRHASARRDWVEMERQRRLMNIRGEAAERLFRAEMAARRTAR